VSDNISMQDSNFDNIPEPEISQQQILSTYEDDKIKIFIVKENKSVFMVINNVTIELDDTQFFKLSEMVKESMMMIVEG
jgi:uncharacterized protein YaeQ